jgi:adenylyltransferase/sulfurtransferase
MRDHSMVSLDSDLTRYSRQTLCAAVGMEGQRRLLASRVVLVGCGALGSVIANTLVRAGVGFLRICDRDFIEPDNLQRQILFDEDDVAANLPKAEAAAAKLRRINSQVTVEPAVVDVHAGNIEQLADGASLLLDGTDNFETRYLINDLAVKSGRPWVYGAVIGTSGLCMAILPGDTPCLRCLFEEAPPPDESPTCDTAGVLAAAVNLVASMQSIEAIKLLMGKKDEIIRRLMTMDAWTGRVTLLNVQSARDVGDCVCCRRRNFEYLNGQRGSSTTALCGRNAVQVRGDVAAPMDLSRIALRLKAAAREPVRLNRFLLQVRIEEYEITVFPDGRAIVKGTDDPDRARSIYAKYVGG